MDSRSQSRFKGAESLLNRSKSLYDGTKNTMRLSNIKSKLQTVSSSLTQSSAFGSFAGEKSTTDISESTKSIHTERDEAEKRLRERSKIGTRGTSVHKHRDEANQKASKTTKKIGRKRDKPKETTSSTEKKTNTAKITAAKVPIYDTTDYEVQPGDTVTSVAARFDVTPSELCRTNRLFCRSLFPGQLIKVPKLHSDASEDKAVETHSGTTEDGTSKTSANSAQSANPVVEDSEIIKSDEVNTAESVTESNDLDETSCREKKDDHVQDGSDENEESSTQSDVSSETDESSEQADDLLEENNPLAAQYLKIESEYIVDLQSAVPGVLLITTDSLMFNPIGESTSKTDQLHLLLPFAQLRSLAAYADHSVMYFTKRDLQCKSKRRRHRTEMGRRHNCSLSSQQIRLEKSEPSLYLKEEKIPTGKMVTLVTGDKCDKVDTSPPPPPPPPLPTISPPDNVPVTIADASMVQSTHSVTFTDHHLLPCTQLTKKSKSTEFTLSNHCLVEENKPTCSLRDLEQPDSVVYLCVLAHPTGSMRKRHPYWFTLQSMEYWFRIPEEKSEILFDFLLVCDFGEQKFSEPAGHSLSKDDGRLGDAAATSTEPVASAISMHGSKTTPDNLFQGETDKPTGFLVVPNTFDWVLPRIGSIDEYSKLMLKRSQHRKRRTHSCREPDRNRVNSASARDALDQTSSSLKESMEPVGKEKCMQAAYSVPSVEEERAALKILKQESVRWEWIAAPLRSIWHHIEHWLVNASELESEQENAKRCAFILNCMQLATPENLPLPIATEQSAILDAHKVRDLMRNLPPEAEGLDWQLTYSTAQHGFSLRTLYHRCWMLYADEVAEPSTLVSASPIVPTSSSGTSPFSSNEPCIMVIRTAKDEIFGAMLNTHPYASSGRFYGNGSCYVFRWIPHKARSRRHAKPRHRRSSAKSEVDKLECQQQQQHPAPPLSTQEELHPVEDPAHSNPLDSLSPFYLAAPRDSLRSTSSVSDTDSSAFIEQGEEVTEEFARLFYFDESEENATMEQQNSRKMRFQKYIWTGKNAFFISGENESLSIGCSQGHSAIHLDDVLLHGRTELCDTFANEPLCDSGDFLVSNLEIWSFR